MDTQATGHTRTRARARNWTLALVAVALVVVALRATVCAPEPVPVRVALVVRDRVEETITNSRAGTVKARRRARLSPQEGGLVVALPKREGDRVEAGELLLELESSVQRAQLELAEREAQAAGAERERACLAAQRAARERERNRALADRGVIADDVLDELESAAKIAGAACAAARASLERAGAQVELVKRQLAHTQLRAPFDGVIAEQSVEVGEWATPSVPLIQAPGVIDLIDPTSIFVSAPMDEVDAGRLRVGLPARVAVDSHPGEHFPGTIVRVGAYVNDVEEQNRTVEIEVELEDEAFAATLLPGTSADVEVVLETREGVLRIPTSALLSGNRALVLVDGALEERDVDVGLRNWDVSEVRGGLAEGDAVVVSLDRAEVKAGVRARAESDAAP
ncbi:MAG: efflux RND transporter periplasmic adaptor subunit [Myxococcota bacterium]|nr:efflux RND transporter periplasmic adaptor subunit [Myxococcales bacterium]